MNLKWKTTHKNIPISDMLSVCIFLIKHHMIEDIIAFIMKHPLREMNWEWFNGKLSYWCILGIKFKSVYPVGKLLVFVKVNVLTQFDKTCNVL